MASDIRCRVAACPDKLDGSAEWDFYLINDGDVPFESAVLESVACEWGGVGGTEAVEVRVAGLGPGANAFIWHDDGDGAEMRMDLTLRVRAGGREARLNFEFPKLYLKTGLKAVPGLGKPGWAVEPDPPSPLT